MQIKSHDDGCAVLLEWDNRCTCKPLESVSKPTLREPSGSARVKELEARVAELETAMGNLLLAAEHVSVFVNSRERIQSTTGKTWYEDQLAIARSALNP